MAHCSTQRDPIILTHQYVECSQVVKRTLDIIYTLNVGETEQQDANTLMYVIDFANKWDIAMITDLVQKEVRRKTEKGINHQAPNANFPMLDLTGGKVKIMGRYSLDAIGLLESQGSPVEVVSCDLISMGFYKLYFMARDSDRLSKCRLTESTLFIIKAYVKEPYAATIENSSGLRLCIRVINIENKSSPIVISPDGSLRFSGSDRYMEACHEALGHTIRTILTSTNSQRFIASLAEF